MGFDMNQRMTWKEIREKYPDTFVLLDHCEEKRIDDMHSEILGAEVIFATPDGKRVFDEYRQRGKPAHMTFAHTHSPKLEIEEVRAPSLRFLHE